MQASYFGMWLISVLAVGADAAPAAGIVVDKAKRTVTIDAKVAPRKINDPRFKEIYPIEVIACWAFPKGQKAHETVVTIEAKPSDVHNALLNLGLKPGAPVLGESKEPARGPEVNVYIELTGSDGEPRRIPIEKMLLDRKTNKPMPKLQWRFTGSALKQPDPTVKQTVYGADVTGTLLSIFPVTNDTVFQTNLTMKEEKYVKLETDKKLLPTEGASVKLILEVPAVK